MKSYDEFMEEYASDSDPYLNYKLFAIAIALVIGKSAFGVLFLIFCIYVSVHIFKWLGAIISDKLAQRVLRKEVLSKNSVSDE